MGVRWARGLLVGVPGGRTLEWFDLVFLDRLLRDGTCSGLRLWWLLTCSEMRDEKMEFMKLFR